MPKISKSVVTLIVILLGTAVVLGLKYVRPSFGTSSSHKGALARVKGDRSAKIRVTEFMDFQCPACAQGAVYLKKVMEEHPKAVRLEMKYFPLHNHQHSFLSARYAECAARQGKFWPFHDYLIERQANWSRLADAKPAFDLISQEIGLNPQEVDACLRAGKADAVIQNTRSEGDTLGVRSTPTYYVNGRMVVGAKNLELELNKLLAEGDN